MTGNCNWECVCCRRGGRVGYCSGEADKKIVGSSADGFACARQDKKKKESWLTSRREDVGDCLFCELKLL